MNFTLRLVNPGPAIRKVVFEAWEMALTDLAKWMEKDLVKALVFGGLGIEGIAQTPFYKFITSAEGLSQLGIEKTEPPRLLRAYEKTAFKVTAHKRVIHLKFGDIVKLKAATPHPANGTGNLQIESWLNWIVDGEPVLGRGFVPRRDIPENVQEKIRLGSPLGGLMLPKGALGRSLGSWRFPAQFAN